MLHICRLDWDSFIQCNNICDHIATSRGRQYTWGSTSSTHLAELCTGAVKVWFLHACLPTNTLTWIGQVFQCGTEHLLPWLNEREKVGHYEAEQRSTSHTVLARTSGGKCFVFLLYFFVHCWYWISDVVHHRISDHSLFWGFVHMEIIIAKSQEAQLP